VAFTISAAVNARAHFCVAWSIILIIQVMVVFHFPKEPVSQQLVLCLIVTYLVRVKESYFLENGRKTLMDAKGLLYIFFTKIGSLSLT